jgi:predicted rRNA methylase YqxC with S4 and FtsJ domains
MSMAKKRLDLRLMEAYPQYSRTQLHSFIIQGKVTVGGGVCAKPGPLVAHDAEKKITAQTATICL